MSIDPVAEAKRILSEAGFPLEQIEIRPATTTLSSLAEPDSEGTGETVDRKQVLAGVLELMADGQPRMAKDIAKLLRERGVANVTRRDVNSIISKEGRGKFVYNSTTYMYKMNTSN